MHYQYQTEGTCSAMIEFDLDNNIIHNVNFLGGCNGNLQGISKLVEGLPAEQVISRLQGIRCGWKDTSCPDQLTRALKQALARQ
ncbi:MAG: TIGR03905 family TSCPD domain-containing protein [Bacteroidales bacterium]|nr:TIGR03905 family TSCPD domain-containing protein [Candidatus Colimorpha merdihippi]